MNTSSRPLIFIALLISGCNEAAPTETEKTETSITAESTDPPLPDNDTTQPDTEDSAVDDYETEEESVCRRWNDDRVDLDEGTWSGSVGQCNAGEISANARKNALRLVNLYRRLADLPIVDTSTDKNNAAQACSLIMHANQSLSHSPSSSAACYSELGGTAAGSSNLSPYPGVYSVDLYMADMGNETTLGHRRWILSNSLGPIGLGSTSDYSCMHVIGGSGNAGAAWVAFPPPGTIPIEMMNASWMGVDETGWSIQSDSIDLQNANVTVTRDDGQELPMLVTVLLPYYGSNYAISMIPQGWSTEIDRDYTISVSGINSPIEYTVSPVLCSQ